MLKYKLEKKLSTPFSAGAIQDFYKKGYELVSHSYNVKKDEYAYYFVYRGGLGTHSGIRGR